MRKLFTPAEVKHWTTLADLEQVGLVGKYVAVWTPSSPEYKADPLGGGDWEGGSGTVEGAGFTDDGRLFVDWDWGMSWAFRPDGGSWVAVCDEHGDHTSLNGVDCQDRFGIEVGTVKP